MVGWTVVVVLLVVNLLVVSVWEAWEFGKWEKCAALQQACSLLIAAADRPPPLSHPNPPASFTFLLPKIMLFFLLLCIPIHTDTDTYTYTTVLSRLSLSLSSSSSSSSSFFLKRDIPPCVYITQSTHTMGSL